MTHLRILYITRSCFRCKICLSVLTLVSNKVVFLGLWIHRRWNGRKEWKVFRVGLCTFGLITNKIRKVGKLKNYTGKLERIIGKNSYSKQLFHHLDPIWICISLRIDWQSLAFIAIVIKSIIQNRYVWSILFLFKESNALKDIYSTVAKGGQCLLD